MPWGYHLTSRNAALKMKTGGMLSSEKRLKVTVANPNGAFARNRDSEEPRLRSARLKRDIACLVFAGAKVDATLQTQLDTLPIGGWRPLGVDPLADRAQLDLAATAALERFRDQVPGMRGKKLVWTGTPYVKVWKGSEVAQAVPLFQARMTHFLTRLSVQYMQLYYRIEELQTTTHVYFSQPEDAVQLYGSYKKHLGAENPLVILRVDLDKVAWEVDVAQGGAIKVKDGVTAELLQVMEKHDNFANEAFRHADENWKRLSEFAAQPVRERPRNGYAWPPIDR